MTNESTLHAIYEKLDELKVAIATQSTLCGQCLPRLGDLEATVKGNGRKGLLSRVARVEVVLTLVGVTLIAVVLPLAIGAMNAYATLRQAEAIHRQPAAQHNTMDAQP